MRVLLCGLAPSSCRPAGLCGRPTILRTDNSRPPVLNGMLNEEEPDMPHYLEFDGFRLLAQ